VSLEQIFFKVYAMTCFLIKFNLNTASRSGKESKFYCYLLYYYYYYHHHRRRRRHHRLFISGNRKHYRRTYSSQLFPTSAMLRHADCQICTGNHSHPLPIVLPSSKSYRALESKEFLRNVSIYLTDRTAPCPRNQLSVQSTRKKPKISAVFLS
jgi:hypothetical protein